MIPIKEKVALICAVVECFFFGGTIFGWASLVYVLKEDNIFRENCFDDDAGISSDTRNATTTQCPYQEENLTLVFTLSISLMGVSSFPFGYLFDRFGLRVMRITMIIIAASGYLMLAFANEDTSWIVFPGAISVALSNVLFIMTNSNVSLLARDKSSTLVTLNTGAVSSSAIVFLFIKLASDSGITRNYSFLVLIGLLSLVIFSTLFLLPKNKITAPFRQNGKAVNGISNEAFNPDNNQQSEPEIISQGENKSEKQDINDKITSDKATETGHNNSNLDISQKKSAVTESTMQQLKDNLITQEYLLHLMWFGILHLRLQFFLGTFNTWLNDVLDEDQDQVSFVTNVFGYIQPVCLILAPVAGILMDTQKMSVEKKGLFGLRKAYAANQPLFVGSIFAILTGVTLLFEETWMIYVVIGLQQVFRTFLYACANAYFGLVFPGSLFGITFGIGYFVAGVCAIFQFPLFIWAESNGFFIVNCFLLVLTVITLLHPANLIRIYLRALSHRKDNNPVSVISITQKRSEQ